MKIGVYFLGGKVLYVDLGFVAEKSSVLFCFSNLLRCHNFSKYKSKYVLQFYYYYTVQLKVSLDSHLLWILDTLMVESIRCILMRPIAVNLTCYLL